MKVVQDLCSECFMKDESVAVGKTNLSIKVAKIGEQNTEFNFFPNLEESILDSSNNTIGEQNFMTYTDDLLK